MGLATCAPQPQLAPIDSTIAHFDFPIGTTSEACEYTDADEGTVSAPFMVTVLGAPQQTQNLIITINGMGLPGGLTSSLDTQLQAVATDLGANNSKQACKDLAAYDQHVQAQDGKMLTPVQYLSVINPARNIGNVIPCPVQ
jgi:hypothetical protein